MKLKIEPQRSKVVQRYITHIYPACVALAGNWKSLLINPSSTCSAGNDRKWANRILRLNRKLLVRLKLRYIWEHFYGNKDSDTDLLQVSVSHWWQICYYNFSKSVNAGLRERTSTSTHLKNCCYPTRCTVNEESPFAIGWQTNLLSALEDVSHGEVVAPRLVVSSVCVRPETSQDVWGSMSWQVATYVASGQSRAETFCIVKVFFTHRGWIYFYMLECGSGKNSLAPIRLCVNVLCLRRKSFIDVFLIRFVVSAWRSRIGSLTVPFDGRGMGL